MRVLVLHHATFSINSLCHFFGRRPFATGDESRNLAWLAPIALGEGWHNNHHAFPTSARHGLRRGQIDPSAWLIGGTVTEALTGLLWGGAVRMLVLHHSTYSINSLCHYFGRKNFKTGDESRNLFWLSFFTFGEAWHNNHHAFPTSARHGLKAWQFDPSHHAFPTSARHGLKAWQFDPSSWVIWGLEKSGLAWDVVKISPERQAAKLAA